MPSVFLSDRSVVAVQGPETRDFLDRIVTCDLAPLGGGGAAFGALLSPQGKILADFVAFPGAGRDQILLDTSSTSAADLIRRLNLYRLRAKLTVVDRSEDRAVMAGWGGEPEPDGAVARATDPRLAELGWRAIVDRNSVGTKPADETAYHARRVRLGVPEAGRDFPFGDAFPHEAVMDQLHGVDFRKGCYVGQEIVSRMQHRGTARTRIVSVEADEALEGDREVTAGGRPLGRIGSVAGTAGLAMLRLDRAADAISAGETLLAGDTPLRLVRQPWMGFPVPGTEAAPVA